MLVVAFLAAAALPRALVVYSPLQDKPSITDLSILKAVSKAGYASSLISAGEMEAVPNNTRLLVLADSRNLPARLALPVNRFLKSKGRLIALRAPAWQNHLYSVKGKWVNQDEYGFDQAKRAPDRLILDLAAGPLTGWVRSSNDMASQAFYEVESSGLGESTTAIHVKLADLTSWDTSMSPPLDKPFARGMTITQFAAKGGPRTSQMVVEWRENDGSRWIATVSLSRTWRLHRLAPASFKYWTSVPNRGFAGDTFNPANACSVSFGMAFTHNGAVGGKHEFWIANFGASLARTGEPADSMSLELSPTDGIYPNYKFFKTTVPVSVLEPKIGRMVASLTGTYSLQPRPEPNGFDKRRQWTFEPLLEARDSAGDWRGIPAALIRWNGGERKGAGLASFAATDAAFYRNPAILQLITKVAQRLNEDVWLVDAGSDRYTQFKGERVNVGATVYSNVEGKCRVSIENAGRQVLQSDVALHAGQTSRVTPVIEAAEECLYRTCLSVGGKLIEARDQAQHVYAQPVKKSFVTKSRCEFMLDGKPIRFNGVNYMPSSGIGTEDGEYFEFWIDRQAYDPNIVSRDLKKIKSLGLNAVSAFIYDRSVEAGNLLDFIRQCRELGLKINLSLRPGTPMDFNWGGVRQIISVYRLKDEDTVFAYDLAWEPSMYNHAARKRYDENWRNWVISTYGSLAKAEDSWVSAMPAEDGKPTNPPDSMLVSDGKWRKMVADYRRFVNDLLFVHYYEARRNVRSIDPNHLVSFRMSEAGNPTFNWDAFMPYELPGIAWATDFLAPEAYGRGSGWDQAKPGLFEVDYCKSLPPHNPVIWAEAGMSCLDSSRLSVDPALVEKQGELYRNLYRMAIESESNGIFWWWYPGGVRIGENSDYGIVNPDGTDRPSTQAIREFGPKFLALRSAERPLKELAYSLDDDSRGLFGIYQKLIAVFWRLKDADFDVRLRDIAAQYDKDPAIDQASLNRIYEKLGLPKPSN